MPKRPISFKLRVSELVSEVKLWQDLYNTLRDAAEKRNTELTERGTQLKGDYAVLWTAAGRVLHAYNNVGATSLTLAGSMHDLETARASTATTRQDQAANEAAFNTARRMGKHGSIGAALKAAETIAQVSECCPQPGKGDTYTTVDGKRWCSSCHAEQSSNEGEVK